MKIAIITIILIAIIGSMAFNSIAPAAAAPFTMTVDPATEQHILQSTVQIAMYAFDDTGRRGLGTVVRHNGQTVIVTHDHWSHFDVNLNVVEFRDAMGGLVLVLDAAEFRSLIQYRDGGTMILAVPARLTGMVPAAPAGPDVVAAGDKVWMARRKPVGNRTTVEVIGAMVNGVQDGGSVAYLQMSGSGNAAVIPGDSGGGVWVKGLLVANVWSGGVMVDLTQNELSAGPEPLNKTNSINAALNPVVVTMDEVEQVGETAVTNLEAKLMD